MPKGDYLKLKADPDDGTTPISNLLLEAVAIASLSGTEKGIILYLWRNTYGWSKGGEREKESTLSQEELAKYFRIDRRNIYASLKQLVEKHILLRADLGQGKGYSYQINTKINSWNSNSIDKKMLKELDTYIRSGYKQLPLMKTSPPDENTDDENIPSTPDENIPSDGMKTSHPTLYKEILNKYKETFLLDLPANEVKEFLTFKLAQLMLANNPKVKIPENLNAWINEMRLMIEVDKRTPEEILQVIEFSQKDPFWCTNILSAGKLREKFDQLYLKIQKGGSYGGKKPGAHKQGYSTFVPKVYHDPDHVAVNSDETEGDT